MAETRTVITISFKPLLKQVAAHLGLLEPVYYCSDTSKNISYVVVPTETGPPDHIFWGEEGGSLDESSEQAAKKGVLYLVKKHSIRVQDVNLEQKENLELGIKLYKLKQRELECHEKGVPYDLPSYSDVFERANQGINEVRLDYYDLLRKVVNELNITIPPIQCLQYANNEYVTRFAVDCPNSFLTLGQIVGEKSSSVFEAKQSFAKKAILYLMARHRFEVEDVNFHFLGLVGFSLNMQIKSLYAVKERVTGVKQEPILRPEVRDGDQYSCVEGCAHSS